MLKPAELILTPNACELHDKEAGLGAIFVSRSSVRAFENAVGVAMANCAAPQLDGHSVAFDANGAALMEAGPEEGVFIAGFDLRRISPMAPYQTVQRRETPEIYERLSDPRTSDPLGQSRTDMIAHEKRRRNS